MNSTVIKLMKKNQQGAVMVEAVIVMLVFLLFVFAIIEAAFALLQYARAVEATRAAVRYAVVNTPVCDLYDETGLSIADCPLDCSATSTSPYVSVNCAAGGIGCGNVSSGTGILGTMTAMLPTVTASNVNVTYACSGAGSDENPEPIPTVTIGTQGLTHPLILPGLFGFADGFALNIPAYSTTRLGEDLHTVP